jgi:hypothetical protein
MKDADHEEPRERKSKHKDKAHKHKHKSKEGKSEKAHKHSKSERREREPDPAKEVCATEEVEEGEVLDREPQAAARTADPIDALAAHRAAGSPPGKEGASPSHRSVAGLLACAGRTGQTASCRVPRAQARPTGGFRRSSRLAEARPLGACR